VTLGPDAAREVVPGAGIWVRLPGNPNRC
jgi:hypothetical protein